MGHLGKVVSSRPAASPRWDDAPAEAWEGNGPCTDCGARCVVWHAPHELWESVMECEPGGGGLLCPTCFVARAYAKGLDGCVWYVVPVPKHFDPKVPLEGRVTPTYHRFVGEPAELFRQWYAGFVNCAGAWEQLSVR